MKYFLILNLFFLFSCKGDLEVTGFSNKGKNLAIDETQNLVKSYPFEIDEDEINSYATYLGFPLELFGMPVLSNDKQKISITTTDDQIKLFNAFPKNSIYFIMDPLTTPPATLDFSSGVKAVEFEASFPEKLETGGSYTISASFMTFPTLIAHLSIAYGTRPDGTYVFNVVKNGVTVLELNTSHSFLPSKIGFEFNANTATYKVYLDNVEQTLTDNTYVPGHYVGGLGIGQVMLTGNNIGLAISVGIVADASKMTTTFRSDATDPFGKLIQ